MFSIMVVDDEPELRKQLEWAARGEGRTVMAAESSDQAARLIQQQDFDVVVTDLKMEMSGAGLAVLKAAKEKDVYTQVIVVTSYGRPEDSVEMMRHGAFDYLERSSPGTDVLAMVRSKITLALDFRQAMLARKIRR